MFNFSTKNEALKIHKEHFDRYNASHKSMADASERLYDARLTAIDMILTIEDVINSIANSPKEFEIEMGKVKEELNNFKKTEEYAKQAYEEAVKAGKDIAGGAAVGIGVAAMAPTAFMGIATTFGTATTGTAISALSGAAAQKAALAWLGRTFAGFAVKEGAGMAVGQAFLALAGPIGWGINGACVGLALFSLNKKNKEIAEEAMKEAKEISIAREALDESKEKMDDLLLRTSSLFEDLEEQEDKIKGLKGKDYSKMNEDEKTFLGTTVNNTLTLSSLLNETIQ